MKGTNSAEIFTNTDSDSQTSFTVELASIET
jgi:hypothetical protein